MERRGLPIGRLEIGRTRGVRPLALIAAAALVLGGCATLGIGGPEPVTVDQVVAMSRSGLPADAILERMRDSGTVYRLSASQLAKLHDDGVPDAVLDYMQDTYLESVRQRQELNDWHYWTGVDGYWYGGLPYGWSDDWFVLPEVPSRHHHWREHQRG